MIDFQSRLNNMLKREVFRKLKLVKISFLRQIHLVHVVEQIIWAEFGCSVLRLIALEIRDFFKLLPQQRMDFLDNSLKESLDCRRSFSHQIGSSFFSIAIIAHQVSCLFSLLDDLSDDWSILLTNVGEVLKLFNQILILGEDKNIIGRRDSDGL